MIADPRRWYLRIGTAGGAGGAAVGPLPLPNGVTAFPTGTFPVEVHFRDAPALCVGPWGGSGIAGLAYHIWEDLFTGGG